MTDRPDSPGLTRRLLVTVGLCASCLTLTSCQSAPGYKTLDVFAVRHAEKADGPDPRLTLEGRNRAKALSNVLADRGITAIHSSDTQRTRQTALPIAERLGMEVEIYDPRDLDGLISKLRARGGTHLVVGHSNTTPDLVERLGGDPGAPIREADEYDRMYLVTKVRGDTRTVVTRYGD